jgi:hypothetical protein
MIKADRWQNPQLFALAIGQRQIIVNAMWFMPAEFGSFAAVPGMPIIARR